MKISTRRIRDVALGLSSLAAFLIIWQIVAIVLNSPFLPGPYTVLLAAINQITVGDLNGNTLQQNAAASLYRVMLGFLAGVVTAVPLGLIMGINYNVRTSVSPLVEIIRFIPPIAWIPLSIVLLSGLSRFVFIIWIGVFFPVLLNTIAGVRRTSITLINVGKTFGADESTIIRKVVFPSALPEIMTGLRVGLGIGWVCIVAAELIGGTTLGLGVLMTEYANLLQLDVVIVGMITIGVLGLIMNYAILLIEKRMFRYRVEVST